MKRLENNNNSQTKNNASTQLNNTNQNSYLLIDNNTLSRESFSSLIYAMDCMAVVYETASMEQAKQSAENRAIDTLIFNASIISIDFSKLHALIHTFKSPCKILLIINETQVFAHEDMLNDYLYTVITVSSSTSEIKAAIKSLKIGKKYIGNAIRTSDVSDYGKKRQDGFNNDSIRKLTTRQCEVLKLIVKGYANKLIAYELGVSEGTIKLHVSSILRALNVTNRTEAAMRAGQFLQATAY